MGTEFEDALIDVGSAILGKSKLNEILINRLVKKGRSRPHPWSTRCGHICWSGLTDRTYNARLLPPKHHTGPEGPGTPRPPLADTAALFAADPAGQRVCPKSTCLFPAFAQYLTDGFIRTQMANKPPFGDGNEDRNGCSDEHYAAPSNRLTRRSMPPPSRSIAPSLSSAWMVNALPFTPTVMVPGVSVIELA